MPTSPHTVYLLGCAAYATDTDEPNIRVSADGQVCITGLFDVIEFEKCEPSAYVWSDQWLIESADHSDGVLYTVDAYNFMEQVNPGGYASMLVQEREMEIAVMDTDQ